MADSNQHANTGQHDTIQPAPQDFNEERFLKHLTKVQEEFRKEYPNLPASDSDLKVETQWWRAIGDFSAVMNNGSVPKEINEALQAASKAFKEENYSREAFEKFAVEAKTLLADHHEALRVMEETILKNPDVWEKMREYSLSKPEKPEKD
ncbi:hypothetical protein QBC37DRAFT_432736 [Rhypophila decipiens]|uniref:Uncharacterized protein n=1 Tax=Rhypophila decipiens TaxID=261697 RepID=A0AAN6XWG7_9PEZI|nr:hypothetical protein QBC37DRAFT_432736 [Rhypophila decipiens]